MALQYYKTSQGNYVIDTSTGKASTVTTIPAGGATITWTGSGLPPQLATALNQAQSSNVNLPNNAVTPTNNNAAATSPTQSVGVTSVSPSTNAVVPGNNNAAAPTVNSSSTGYIAPNSVPVPSAPGGYSTESLGGQGVYFDYNGNQVSKQVYDDYMARYQVSANGGGYLPGTAPAQTAQTTTQTAPVSSQYQFQKLPNGNVEIYESGKPVSTGSGFAPSYAQSLGYSGTDTFTAASGTGTQTGTTGTNSTSTQVASTVSDVDLTSKLLALGLSQDQISQLDPTQKALLATVGDIATNTYANGSGITLNDALTYAAQDPTILAKYGDALKIDQATMQQGLQQLQQSTNQQSQQYQQQFENDRKSLSDAQAAAGTAYSGFRGQAQKQLADQEGGIVTSSKQALQKSLQDATTAFETKYGTSATNPATATYLDPTLASNVSLSGLDTPGTTNPTTLAGTTTGGITGTQPIAKQQDILAKAASTYQFGQLPSIS